VRWRLWWTFVVLWTVALLMPLPRLKEKGPEWDDAIFTFSKSVHIGAYAFFAGLSAWLHVPARHRWLLLVFMGLHGAGTEFLQWLLPTGRNGCLRDVGLDYIGILLGVALTWKWWPASRRSDRNV